MPAPTMNLFSWRRVFLKEAIELLRKGRYQSYMSSKLAIITIRHICIAIKMHTVNYHTT